MACSRRVFPAKVIEAVALELSKGSDDDPLVPENMTLAPSMRTANLGDSTMVEVEVSSSPDNPTLNQVDVLRGREMVRRHTKEFGSIGLVIRRPAMSLAVLAAQKREVFQGFDMFGIIKETGVDDEGVRDFHGDYFSYPLYVDKSYAFYEALGNRRVSPSFVLNPMSIVSFLCEAYNRITTKGIGGNFKGEGIVQGGVIVFDKSGKPRYAYQEETGIDLPVRDILAAVLTIKRDEEQMKVGR